MEMIVGSCAGANKKLLRMVDSVGAMVRVGLIVRDRTSLFLNTVTFEMLIKRRAQKLFHCSHPSWPEIDIKAAEWTFVI